MNKDDRKTLDRIRSEIEAQNRLLEALDVEEIKTKLDALQAELQDLKDAEQEKIDNLPENMQSGDKASEMAEIVDKLENAQQLLGDSIEQLDTLNTITGDIGEAVEICCSI